MNALQLLRKTRGLLSDATRWVTSTLRQDDAYCLVGALQWSWEGQTHTESWVGPLEYEAAKIDLQYAIHAYFVEHGDAAHTLDPPTNMDLPAFNDLDGCGRSDHRRILDVLDKAIGRAERRIDEYVPPGAEELLSK